MACSVFILDKIKLSSIILYIFFFFSSIFVLDDFNIDFFLLDFFWDKEKFDIFGLLGNKEVLSVNEEIVDLWGI